MKAIKYITFVMAITINIIRTSFSAELPSVPEGRHSVYIAVLENGALIGETPFANRVTVVAKPPLKVDDDPEHGVIVCSVLVGQNSTLPPQVNVTVVPTISHFEEYLKKKEPSDFVVLNWSGSIGNPGMFENEILEIGGIGKEFDDILSLDEANFAKIVRTKVEELDDTLKQLQIVPDNHLSPILIYIKNCLLEAEMKHSIIQDMKKDWLFELSSKLKFLKNYGEKKSWDVFNDMKKSLMGILAQHDNTLLVWALGNEGTNCDDSRFWKELLSEETILRHSLLVYGHDSSMLERAHRESNYTKKFSDHTVAKPYKTFVWDKERLRYVKAAGTSLSAPLATIDAFSVAQKLVDQGQLANYAAVKAALIKQ